MKKGSFLFATSALALFMAAAAHATPVFDPTGFDLRETSPFHIAVQPVSTLDSSRTNATYHLVPGGIALISEARKPTAYHARQPRTELSETRSWRIQDANAALDTTIQLDRFPKKGNMVLAELTPDDDSAPVLRLLVDGDRIVLRGQLDNAPTNGTVLGTFDTTRRAHIVLHTRPDGQLDTEVNGTAGHFRLSPSTVGLPVMFRVGAHAINDIGTTPDQVAVTLTGLSVRHGIGGSGLRT